MTNYPQSLALASINLGTLTPLVRRHLQRENCEITGWTYRALQGGAGDVGAVHQGFFVFQGRCRLAASCSLGR